MGRSATRIFSISVLALGVLSSGCTEVRGRKKIQEANKLYKDGNYKEAVALFEQAEKLIPGFPTLWLNKGYTCRQMIVPGSDTPDNKAASKCATEAFQKYMQLAPNDARGENLYVQTLFDSNMFDVLSSMYEDRFSKNPRDMDAIMGLIQTYTKANRLDDALTWYKKKAEIQANDPEAQYAVGVYIYQQLSQRGGGPDKGSYVPEGLVEAKPGVAKAPTPQFVTGDIVSQQRIDLADHGISYLVKATEMRPKYHEAMAYLTLLNMQKSFAYFNSPEDWRKTRLEAEKWKRAALEAQGKPLPPPVPAAPAEAAEGAAPKPEEAVAAAATTGKGKAVKGKGKANKRKLAKARAAKRGKK